MKATKKKIRRFENELKLWNFQRAVKLVTELDGFPKNAFYLLSSLMHNYGDCGSQRTGYAYVGVPRTLKSIMEIASPWLDKHTKGGKVKPKAIAVNVN